MIFNMDISYYMFTKPLIEAIIKYIMQFVILISAYITAFYIIVFNLYFDGIDRTMLRKSKLRCPKKTIPKTLKLLKTPE